MPYIGLLWFWANQSKWVLPDIVLIHSSAAIYSLYLWWQWNYIIWNYACSRLMTIFSPQTVHKYGGSQSFLWNLEIFSQISKNSWNSKDFNPWLHKFMLWNLKNSEKINWFQRFQRFRRFQKHISIIHDYKISRFLRLRHQFRISMSIYRLHRLYK